MLNYETQAVCSDCDIIEFICKKTGKEWNDVCEEIKTQDIYPDDGEGSTTFSWKYHREGDTYLEYTTLIMQEMKELGIDELTMVVD